MCPNRDGWLALPFPSGCLDCLSSREAPVDLRSLDPCSRPWTTQFLVYEADQELHPKTEKRHRHHVRTEQRAGVAC